MVKVVVDGVEYMPAPPPPVEKALADALDCQIEVRGLGSLTVRSVLHKLLSEVWREVESFNGKRPFGYSHWYLEIRDGLRAGGFIPEEDEEFDWDKYVFRLIDGMCFGFADKPDEP